MTLPSVRHLLTLSGVFMLAGCSVLLPGTTLSIDAEDRVPPPEVAPELADIQTRVYTISPQLLAVQPVVVPAPPKPNPALDAELAAYEYRVGAGDVLTVTVWDHPEFQGGAAVTPQFSAQQMAAQLPGASAGGLSAGTGTQALDTTRPQGLSLQVQRDGSIYFPFVGRMKVSGLTVPVIRDQLSRGLSRYIQSPQLDIAITAFRSQRIYLTGDIGKAGSLPVTTDPLTLFDAIAAIGLSPTPDMESVTLIRNGQRRPYSLERLFRYGDASENVLLRSGDTLHFAKNNSRKVFMFGELVAKGGAGNINGGGSGVVPIGNDGLTLGAALVGAGGIDQLAANPKGVFVMRAVVENGKRYIDVYQLDVTQATAYVMADRFMLKQRDFVYVTAAPIVRFNRVMQQILPSVANLFFLSRLGGAN